MGLALKSRKTFGCFELKLLISVLMLIPCAWTQESNPLFNVTCDSDGLCVKILFSKLFTGIVYAKGYRFDPLCSTSESSAWNVSLTLPTLVCGTHVQEANRHWISNTVVIQQHPLIRTTDDYEKSISCSLHETSENVWSSNLLLDQIYDSHLFPKTKPSPDIELGLKLFNEIDVENIDSRSVYLPIFHLQNRTIYNDIGIKACIAHDAGILDQHASINQITNSRGCFTSDSRNSSNLKIIRASEGVKVYVGIETLDVKSSDNFYVTCEVFICKATCMCSEIDQQQSEYSTAVLSHKLTKRSTDALSEKPSQKQYESRNRFLKSTVKALVNSIMEIRRENAKKLKVKKRTLRAEDFSIPFEADSIGLQAAFPNTDIFVPEPVSTQYYNMKPHLIDIYNNSDYEGFYRNNRAQYSTVELSTVNSSLVVVELPEEFKDNGTKNLPGDESQHIGKKMVSEHEFQEKGALAVSERELPEQGTKVVSERELHENVTDVDTEEELLEESTKSVAVSERELQEKGTRFVSQRELHENVTEVDSEQELFEESTKSIEDLQGKDSTILADDMVSSVNETTENENLNTSISNFPAIVDGSSYHLGSCISRLRFIIVLVVMGFVIGVLLMVSCGMAMYIKKVKKRHRLDDFLLYSWSF